MPCIRGPAFERTDIFTSTVAGMCVNGTRPYVSVVSLKDVVPGPSHLEPPSAMALLSAVRAKSRAVTVVVEVFWYEHFASGVPAGHGL